MSRVINTWIGKDWLNWLYCVSIFVFVVSIISINYLGCVWYNFDMYSDMFVAEKMADSLSVIPQDWIFGNQLYFFATPVLAALFNLVFHNGFISMATASTVMMILVLAAFLWLSKLFFEKKSIIIGLFCISGTFIFGNSASQYTQGFQLFYTMASYYACYLIGILFHLGIYLRLKNKIKVSVFFWVIGVILALLLGMQSLRQTLVLYIPICIMDLLFIIKMFFKKEKDKFGKHNLFNIITFIFNIVGYFLVKNLPVKQYTIIDSVGLPNSFSELSENFQLSLKSLLDITGISYGSYGIKWLPLFCCSIIVLLFVVAALIFAIAKKELSPKTEILIFCYISLLSVLGVGVLLFKIRAIYLFVWFLIGVFSTMYVFSFIKRKKLKQILMVILLAVAAVNYLLNFIIDFSSYNNLKNDYTEIVDELTAMGVNCIYNDFHTAPTIAACSDDKIVSGTVTFDYDSESNGLLFPSRYLRSIDLFKNHDRYITCVVFSNWTMDALDSQASPEYKKRLFSGLDLIKEKEYTNIKYYFYMIIDESLIDYDYGNM